MSETSVDVVEIGKTTRMEKQPESDSASNSDDNQNRFSPFSDEQQLAKQSLAKKPPIPYELATWIVYLIILGLGIADRFFWNVWPRNNFTIGAGSAGTDFVDGLKPGPWSVKLFDIMARASGRYTIIALNMLMFTMMHTLFNYLAQSWLARHVVDFADYVDANKRIHKWSGIGLVVMTLVHVYTIIVPCIVDGFRAQVVLGAFEWPLSERGPKGFKDINIKNDTVSLQGDDVYRLVEMTILLAILLPLSIRWLATRWHIGIHLHGLINVLYFIDIVRRHTHPHSWILNTPFFMFWIADLVIGLYWRRLSPEITTKQISDDYMLMFWKQAETLATVGPKYFLRMKDSSKLERAHVFTALENRAGLDLADGTPWSTCLVIRVYDKKRTVRLWRQDKHSHTAKMAKSSDIFTWGPFHGNMSMKVALALQNTRDVTVVGGGSAAGYLIDSLQTVRLAQLTVLYSTRDENLFHWFLSVTKSLRQKGYMDRTNLYIALSHGDTGYDEKVAQRIKELQAEEESSDETSSSGEGQRGSCTRVSYGRLNFEKLITPGNVVYFQGSGGMQNAVKRVCSKKKSLSFVAGPAYDQEQKKSQFLRSILGFRFLKRGGDTV